MMVLDDMGKLLIVAGVFLVVFGLIFAAHQRGPDSDLEFSFEAFQIKGG
jgi:hypothetical protein